MASRETVLAALRARPETVAASRQAPEIQGSWLRTADAGEQRQLFARMLEAAGGRCEVVPNGAALPAALAATPQFAAARRRVSLVAGAGPSNVAIDDLERPGDLADVDFALLPGVFGVAENGAVWLEGAALQERSVLVLPEHLGIVLPADALVDHMHAAYERLDFGGPGFGCFMSGPSKTADIEQALVVGAHGARSLSVFLLESA